MKNLLTRLLIATSKASMVRVRTEVFLSFIVVVLLKKEQQAGRKNALPCDRPHKGGREFQQHSLPGKNRRRLSPAPKSMQQRDADPAPRSMPSSAAQLPVDAALNAQGLTLLMMPL